MYKLIALDMDGTLLREDKTISERNKMAIQEARRKGVKVVIATGRPIKGVVKYLKELDMFNEDDYVLTFNGALVIKTIDESIISKKYLTGKDIKKIYEICNLLNLNLNAYSDSLGLITSKNNKYTTLVAKRNELTVTEMDMMSVDDEHPFVKVMITDEPEAILRAQRELPKELYEEYTVVKSNETFIEILDKSINKGVGLESLADYLNISPKEIIAMGDEENDLEMIKFAGCGVAMGNAVGKIKDIANYVTDINEEDGVAKAIEKLVINDSE